MFKKTLIALALTTAAMSATATTLETVGNATATTPHSISFQTLTAAKTTTLADIAIVLDIDDAAVLVDGAKMTVTLTGAVFNSGVPAIDDTLGTSTADAVAPTNAGSSVTYTLTTLNGYLDGQTIQLDGLPIILDSVNSDVTATVSFTTAGGAALSGTSASLKVATVANEWSVAVAKLDARIDVADDRETFVGGLTADTLGFTFKDIDTAGAVIVDYTVTITGDFTNIATVTGYTINTAKTEAKQTITPQNVNDLAGEAALANAVFNIVSGANAVSLSEENYTAAIEVKYSTNKTLSLLAAVADNAGGFELNSTSTSINYAPFGPNTQLILNATSTFAEDASVDVTYVSPVTNLPVTLTDIGTAAAKSVTKLGDIVSAAILNEEGITSGKTSLTLSVNAPEGNVTFFAGFKDTVSGSRMALEQVTSTEADAAAAKTSAAAIETDLANAVDGLGALSTGISASGTASSKAGIVSAVATLIATDIAAGTNVSALSTGVPAYSAEGIAAINGVCSTLAAAGQVFRFDTSAASAVAVTPGAVPAVANVCVLQP
jgi:hypothetical protein